MAVAKKKGEIITLYCEHCRWSTELPLVSTEQNVEIPCAHCGEHLYWHHCPACGLGYAGKRTPACPVCEDASLDDISFD